MMQDKPENDPDLSEDDMLDDDFLDEDFGDDFDLDDDLGSDLPDDLPGDLPEEDIYATDPALESAGDDVEYFDDDFGEEDWEDDEDFGDELAGAGAQKEKKSIGMSFNAMVITGAVIVGLGVLAYQVVSKKPQMVERFTTALNMTGATSGPVFGKDEEPADDLTVPTPQASDEDSAGFLNDPELLDQEAPSLDGVPPMPSSIASPEDMSEEEIAGLPEPQDSTLTPMPNALGDDEASLVPRSPEDMPPAPSFSIDARNDQPEDSTDAQEPNRAEDMLKNMMAAREQKKAQEEQPQNDNALLPTPEEAQPPEAVEPAEDVVAEAPQPEQQQEVAEQTPPPAQPAAVDTAMSAELSGKMDMLLDKMGGMQSRIDEINQGTDQKIAALRDEMKGELSTLREEIKNMPAPAPASSGEQNAAPSGVSESQLNALRDEMMGMVEAQREKAEAAQQELEKARADAKAAKEQAAKAEKAAAAAQETPAPAPQKQASSAPVKQAAPTPAPVKKAAAPAPSRTSWVLKAAKPGKAWVSPAGQNTIRGVGVGDTLDGIGRITAINFAGGRWIVQGTGGQIRQ